MPGILDRFRSGNFRCAVLGLGYVGLPFAVNASNRGVTAVGFDVNAEKVRQIAAGLSPIDDVSDDDLKLALSEGLSVTSDPDDLRDLDAYFICVPSPLGRSREPDLSYIRAAAEQVAGVAGSGCLVSLESTTYPGTTEDIVAANLISAGFKLDEDVYVAYSPERVDPGSGLRLSDIPKVVGGVTPASGEAAASAYRALVDDVHLVSGARVAELTKLLENTYRSVNIALANEMAQLAHDLDVSIWETIEAASTKPFGFAAFYPGPGVGGHCIPLDPQYLAWKAREVGGAIRFIDLAEQVNTNMPRYVVDRVAELLNERGLPVRGSRILAVGLTYKPNVADDRESPSVEVVERLRDRGAEIFSLEPTLSVAAVESTGSHYVDPNQALPENDLVLILTDHDGVDYLALAGSAAVVFDTRGAYRKRGVAAPNVIEI